MWGNPFESPSSNENEDKFDENRVERVDETTATDTNKPQTDDKSDDDARREAAYDRVFKNR
jgi:hypothetical protein